MDCSPNPKYPKDHDFAVNLMTSLGVLRTTGAQNRLRFRERGAGDNGRIHVIGWCGC